MWQDQDLDLGNLRLKGDKLKSSGFTAYYVAAKFLACMQSSSGTFLIKVVIEHVINTGSEAVFSKVDFFSDLENQFKLVNQRIKNGKHTASKSFIFH